MYEQRRPDVAVFIDFENVYVSVRDKLNANPNFEAIMDRCSDLGRVVIARAYADWYRYPRVTSALYANAIEPIYVATYYYDKDMGRTGRAIKNSVDMNLCIDAMKTLFTNPNIGRFVLVTGDRDFIPLVNSIRQQGKEVYIIGIGGAASTHLAQSADEFVFYEQLVGKQTGGSAAATAIANRSTEFARGLDPATFEAPPRERERERELPPEPVPAPVAAQPAESDIYAVLVEAIHLVRKRGYVSTLGSIKLVMKELMGGDFKESRYRDLSGRTFAKFKDFVIDAEKRGKVQIFTNGTVNEVFLPGEDPYKLSQFAAALTEEGVVEPVVDAAIITNGRKEPARAEATGEPTGAARRRRRRSRRGQSGIAAPADGTELVSDEPDFDEPDYTPPVDAVLPSLAFDELEALEQLEQPAELDALFEEELPAEFIEAGHPEELIADIDDIARFGPDPDRLDAIFSEADEPIDRPEDVAWDAAASAVAAEAAPPAEAHWDAAAVEVASPAEAHWDAADVEVAPPAEAHWDAAAEAIAAEVHNGFVEDAPIKAAPFPFEAVPSVDEGSPVAVEQADQAPEAPQAAAAATEAVEDEGGDEDDEEVLEPIAFSDEEWGFFTEMMRGFTKPASFQQIFDNLRGLRKEQGLTRTNEQLRTMVKQAINSGLIERSGRGKRVYYSLRAD